jgi:cytochrome b
MTEAALRRVRVWDRPTRLVHWSLLLLVALSWWTAANDHLTWHVLSGLFILGLTLFRLIWGVLGSETARFASFLRGPRTVLAYAATLFDRVRPSAIRVGHNPLGGWSAMLLLLLLLIQACFGLFSVDIDGFDAGPLAALISFENARWAAHWHHRMSGDKAVPATITAPRQGTDRLAALCALAAGAVVVVVSRLPQILR